MENKIIKTEDDFHEIVNATVEKLKGKNYATITAILRSIKDEVDNYLILN